MGTSMGRRTMVGPTALGRGNGTVFGLYVGLGPFVETRPAIGEAGATVAILGDDLKDATSVTFNGIAADSLRCADRDYGQRFLPALLLAKFKW